MRIDTGFLSEESIREQLKEQEKAFSEHERAFLLDTIDNIAKGLKKRRYMLYSMPEELLLGRFEIIKRFK